MIDLLLKGGKIYLNGELRDLCLEIDKSLMAVLGMKLVMSDANDMIDLSERIMVPRAVNSHVHIFSSEWIREAFERGTAAPAVSRWPKWLTANCTCATFQQWLVPGR